MSSAEPSAESPLRHRESRVVRNLRIVTSCTLLSRFLGLTRDIVMASLFGAGTVLDLFVVAFRLPNLTRQLFGEGAMSAAFLPIFLRDRNEHGDQAARETMTAIAVALTSSLSLGVLFAEAGLLWVLTTWSLSESLTLLCQLLMIMLPYLVLICTAALFSAGLHALEVFLWPALIPVVLNIVWLTGAFVASQWTADPEVRVKLIACSILVAGVLQLLLPLVAIQRMGMGLAGHWRRQWSRVRELMVIMMPVVAGTAVIQLNGVIDSLMAWGLALPDQGGPAPLEAWGIPALLKAGTASELYLGQRMYQFPLGVFGIALGTVLFPLMARHVQAGDFSGLRQTLGKGMRLTVAISLPASAGLFLLARPLTNLLFRHGEFSVQNVDSTAQMIAVYGTGVWAYMSLTILNRAFYALGDRTGPLKFGVAALLINVLLNVLFVIPFQGAGLALGSVVATVLQVGMTLIVLNWRAGPLPWDTVLSTLCRVIVTTAMMVGICLMTLSVVPEGTDRISYAVRLVVPLLSGAVSYVFIGRRLGISEIDELLRTSQRKPKPI